MVLDLGSISLRSVLWLGIGITVDLDPAFCLINADPDPGSQTKADPDPGKVLI
jgi:hypothetical protein